MDFYKKQYATLVGRIDDALTQLDLALSDGGTMELLSLYRAKAILEKALREAEEGYFQVDEKEGTQPQNK